MFQEYRQRNGLPDDVDLTPNQILEAIANQKMAKLEKAVKQLSEIAKKLELPDRAVFSQALHDYLTAHDDIRGVHVDH